MDVNGNKNIESTLENDQVSYSSISGDANNLYLVYRFSSSYNVIIKHSEDGGVSCSELIESRRKIYENMWNGCGCKIDYYD